MRTNHFKHSTATTFEVLNKALNTYFQSAGKWRISREITICLKNLNTRLTNASDQLALGQLKFVPSEAKISSMRIRKDSNRKILHL